MSMGAVAAVVVGYGQRVRVVVTGASGNVGTAVLGALAAEPSVSSVVAVARRLPDPERWSGLSVEWKAADVAASDLAPVMDGADAVVHLAWLIQPSRRRSLMDRVNVEGTRRVLDAAVASACQKVVVASSVGAYSPGPKDRQVDESWPTGGIATSTYSVEKAKVERLLDRFEAEHPSVSVVRLRPALIFQREAASEIARLFLGPLVPTAILRPGLLRVLPAVPGLRTQVVHADDVADAYRRAVLSDVRGAFNVAADPVLDARMVAEAWKARTVPVPARLVRAAADVAWRLHLVPADAGWVDLGLETPLLDTGRARRELGWQPGRGALSVLEELLSGLVAGDAVPTPPLAGGRRSGVTTDATPGTSNPSGAWLRRPDSDHHQGHPGSTTDSASR